MVLAIAVILIACCYSCHLVDGVISSKSSSTTKTPTSVRYLESNSWSVIVNNNIEIAIDPLFSGPLDFGIPLLYSGKKRFINGKAEMKRLVDKTDYVLISQGLDDHAHTPTLKELARLRPDMPYIVPPSALSVLLSCGIRSSCITTLMPGRSIELTKMNKKVSITATKGRDYDHSSNTISNINHFLIFKYIHPYVPMFIYISRSFGRPSVAGNRKWVSDST